MISSNKTVNMQSPRPNPENIQGVLDKALSLEELGLTIEAVDEYKKLFPTRCQPAKIIPGLVTCLSKTNSPYKIIKQIEEIASLYNLNNGRLAQFRLYLGLETEKRGHKDLSLDLYKAAAEIDPENSQIKEKIYRLTPKPTFNSRYCYLLQNNLVSADQLQKALSLSKKTKKSVESVLIQEFKIPKKEVGKSDVYCKKKEDRQDRICI